MPRKSFFEKYLDKFRKYYFKFHKIPSLQKCCKIIGISSKSTAHSFYQQLISHHYLDKKNDEYFPTKKLTSIPFFETIYAGFPSPATDDLKSEITIEDYMIDNPNSTLLLKVKGDSMIQAGLTDGDIIVVDKSKKHKVGDIVVAIIDDEYTVKYLDKASDGKYFLRPGNPKYTDIYPSSNLEIFGIVIGSFRRY